MPQSLPAAARRPADAPSFGAAPTVALAPAQSRRPAIGVGILWMLVSTALFVCQDTIVKYLLHAYPATEIAWARYAIHLILVTLFLAYRNPRLMSSRRPVLQLARSSLLISITLFGMLSMRIMPFVDVAAVLSAAPVLVTALAAPMLGERVGLAAWLSVLAGMSGVWAILGKADVTLSLALAFPLIASLCNALYQITTRMLHAIDKPMTTLFYSAIAGVAFCSPFLPFYGLTPSLADAGLMLALGLLGVASHFCLIRAYATAPANMIAPFGYAALLWATLSGIVVFDEAPSLRTILGAALIVGAGLSIFARASRA
ncbi:DMT family transporter [Methylocapsa acidiphila]|uniref:DMT family transporter n=1 Tax=Methylocapsa acidiphila TaxID=133552 RepID=UPI000416DF66|nr:DMT family transporter [Methylocapsa acidiphila]